MKNIFKSSLEEIESAEFCAGPGSTFHYQSETGLWILTGQGMDEMEFESEEELLDYVKEHNL